MEEFKEVLNMDTNSFIGLSVNSINSDKHSINSDLNIKEKYKMISEPTHRGKFTWPLMTKIAQLETST